MSDSRPADSPSISRNSPPEPDPGRADLDALVALVARLRAPDGCPWDREQTLESVRAYLVEEAHEAAAAIDAADLDALREELGDLLFQAAFVGRLVEEAGAFRLADSIAAVHAKMIERHPHVFAPEESGDEGEPLNDPSAVARAWEKRKERGRDGEGSALDGVPASLPALVAAYRLSQKAAGVGFDWPGPAAVLDKVREEVDEVAAELAAPEPDPERVRDEIGDLLLAVANLARHAGVDPESALARGNAKFRRRFAALEETCREHHERPISELSPEVLDALWNRVKAAGS